MNSSDDKSFKAAVEKTGRKKLVMAALWTEVCLVMPAIDAINEGYEVCIVTDASGGTSTEAHNTAIQRLIQAGAVPAIWLQVMLEWQRDWARQDTYDSVPKVAEEHAGAYGIGVRYANQSSANTRAKPGLNQPREFVVPLSGGTLPSTNHSGWSRYYKPSLHTFRRVSYV